MENSQGSSDGSIVNRLTRTLTVWIALVLTRVGSAPRAAQPALRLRGMEASQIAATVGIVITKTRTPGRSHFLVQFADGTRRRRR